MLNDKWEKIVSKLDFAYQPIVNVKSGKLYAVEALLRNVAVAGNFYSIFNLFDEAFHDGILYQLDLELRQKALDKFSKIDIQNIQMFYNLDNRLLYMPDFSHGNTSAILNRLKLDKKTICFELSERGTMQDPAALKNMVNRYQQDGYDIAIDDFGTGISGLQLLYYAEATFIKLDRFFISNIQSDAKKRLFCSSIINMAHVMGIKVIAEGIELKDEYYTCKDIGVDFIQGYMIQKPKTDISKLKSTYNTIKELYQSDKRSNKTNVIDKSKISIIEPISIDTSLHELFIYFKENISNTFVPVVDKFNRLKGVIYEKDIKQLSYSQYGMSLAKNDRTKTKLKKFIKDVVSAEITWGVDKILEIYNISDNDNIGIFITKNNAYYGFINLNNLLNLSYNRNIEIAKNQNPLTKLPGNKQIEEYLSIVFDTQEDNKNYYIVYFDFNDFKPFNDYYGFRQGDRAILVFSEILQKSFNNNVFIAHIGGDDFFLGFNDIKFDEVYRGIAEIQIKFRDMVASLYNEKDRNNGFIETKDRFGEIRRFQLLAVAASIVEVKQNISKDHFDDIIGIAKKESKKIDTPMCISIL